MLSIGSKKEKEMYEQEVGAVDSSIYGGISSIEWPPYADVSLFQ
jgi:hypothetical protein